MKSLLFIVNDLPFFVSHRMPIAIAAKKLGIDVHIASPDSEKLDEIKKTHLQGMNHHVISLSRGGSNPFGEIKTLFSIFCLYKKIKPDLAHLITIKPVLYGSILARLVGVPRVVLAVSGLGAVFIKSNFKMKFLSIFVKALYIFAFSHKKMVVIFQNRDDLNTLSKFTNLSLSKTVLISGSGVNLNNYVVTPEPEGQVVVSMASRLLKDKGVFEFVEAAKILHQRSLNAKFWLIGDLDLDNPASVTAEQIRMWEEEDLLKIIGFSNEINKIFFLSNIVVLPSYREGSPKVLAEAAACARAVVTTDVPGCRDVIINGKTGLLVPVRDSLSLANAIEILVNNPDLRGHMGAAGRKLAEEEFDIKKIVNDHLKIYESLDLLTMRIE